MRFEFLVAYRRSPATNVELTLLDLLSKVLADNLNEFEPADVKDMISLQHERAGDEFVVDDSGSPSRYVLLGFALELPEEMEQLQTVVEEFAVLLGDTPPLFHGIKFEDPLLRVELARYSEEIFALEMKLRRVLTLIYLHANQKSDPYDLLRDETVQPMAKEKPTLEQMRAVAENQFFHLTFSQYIDLNRRPEPRLPTVLQFVRDLETYDKFREEIDRVPVEQEDDAVLLAGLQNRMDPIEKMRNCVAHNRRPTRSVAENYENARPLLNQLLDDYLARWERAPDPVPHAAEPPEPQLAEQLAADIPGPAAAGQPAEVEAAGDNGGVPPGREDEPPQDH